MKLSAKTIRIEFDELKDLLPFILPIDPTQS